MNKNLTFDTEDEFQRKQFAESVLKLLKGDIDITPLVIEGDWGTGKTVFCKKFMALINSSSELNTQTVYVDAFSEDYYNQPLLSILIAVYQVFPSNKEKQRLREILIKLVKATSSISLELVLTKLFGENMKSLCDKFQEELKKQEELCYESVFQERAAIEKTLSLLRETLSLLTKNSSIFIFIDELDRCRPTYTLQMLEAVKHLFDIPNLKLIFFLNRKQLIYSIQHAYGNDEVVANRYLDKFFALKLQLPKFSQIQTIPGPYGQSTELASNTYLDSFLNEGDNPLSQTPLFRNSKYPASLLRELIAQFNLSLRDVEKLCRYLHIYQTLFRPDDLSDGYRLITTFLIFSFSRSAPWISKINDFEETSPWLQELLKDLTPFNMDKYKNSVMEQLQEVLASSGPIVRSHLFDNWPQDHERIIIFLKQEIRKLQTFSP